MSTQVKIVIPQEALNAFCRRWKVCELALFGSVLRDDFRPDSDVDMLVEFADSAEWSLFDFVKMSDELQAMIGRRVDLVVKRSLRNPYRRASILASKEVIYAAE